MKKEILFLVLLILALPLMGQGVGGKAGIGGKTGVGGGNVVFPAPSIVQECYIDVQPSTTEVLTIGSSGGSTGCTSNFTAGDGLIIVYDSWTQPALTGGSVGQTGISISSWSNAGSVASATNAIHEGILYACPGVISAPTATAAITITFSGTATYPEMYLYEVSGLANSSCFDAGTAVSGTGTTNTSAITTAATSTLGQSNELMIAGGAINAGPVYTVGSCMTGTCSASAQTSAYGTTSEWFKTTATTAGTMSINVSLTGNEYWIFTAGFKHP